MVTQYTAKDLLDMKPEMVTKMKAIFTTNMPTHWNVPCDADTKTFQDYLKTTLSITDAKSFVAGESARATMIAAIVSYVNSNGNPD